MFSYESSIDEWSYIILLKDDTILAYYSKTIFLYGLYKFYTINTFEEWGFYTVFIYYVSFAEYVYLKLC